MKVNYTQEVQAEARYIKVEANVRYWDDAEINGESDEDGSNVPFKVGSMWVPTIDIDKGILVDWPQGVKAKFHFKVCDAGSYHLLDEGMNKILSIDNNYVPSGLCHGDTGFGDYIIFTVKEDGSIDGYKNNIDIDEWVEEI